MAHRSHGLFRVLGSLVFISLALADAGFGQGGTTSTLSGVVVDSSGGVVPGADVMAKHNATGVTNSAVTNTEGLFSFPALNTGSYTVTVTLQGFKTYQANDVVLTSGTGASIRAVLQVGTLEEQVLVSSASEIVQTQNSTVTTTISTNQIAKLPLTSRSAMDFVPFMPGVATSNGNRQSVINGLPRGTINITLDGVNVQDNTLRSTDGFFAIVSPRLDAVEEVTVQLAATGADSGGQGAVQVKFVTRSGTNNYTGSGYYFYRNDGLNANTWFNNRNGNPKPLLLQNQEGVRFGGPIMRNKAFFFVNYEEFHQPSDTSRQRILLNPQAQQGLYTYTSGGATRTINLLQLAAANGQTATADPTIARLLRDIQNSTTQAGGVTTIDANLDRLTFNNHVESTNRFPTFRVDMNLTEQHRFSSALNYQRYSSFPDTLNNRDPAFPGFPVTGGQYSQRIGFSNWVRSLFSPRLVNEARVGYSGAPVQFFPELDPSLWSGSTANTNGFNVAFPSVGSQLTSPGGANATTNAFNNPTPSSRNATALLFEDAVTWLKGTHSFAFGGSATQYTVWLKNQTLIPTANIGTAPSDPATAMFTTGNFPGASAAQLTAAQNLYDLITGRVSSFSSEARIDENSGTYAFLGASMQRARMREFDLYVQDQWQPRSNLTLNLGLRYGRQSPFYPTNNAYTHAGMTEVCGISGVSANGTCNLFQPGVQTGQPTKLPQYTSGTLAYNTDTNNFAPTLGVVWVPEHRDDWLGKLMGRAGDFVLRAGYARNYSRAGLSDFTTPFSNNTGLTQSLTRTPSTVFLFRDPGALAPPSFDATPSYPLAPSLTSSINGFAANIQVPSADSVSVGVQRALDRNTAIEVRYVGTWGHDIWLNQNYNEFDIFNNGFVDEFRKAQANLQANIAAGRGNTFAFTGVPGTSPLPIFLAYFNGVNSVSAGDPAKYTGSNWTNSTNLGFLAIRNPNPFAFACLSAGTSNPVGSGAGCSATTRQNGFIGNATFRANAAAAGLPANFFIVNPDALSGAFITDGVGVSRYNALQVEMRRRLAGGLQAQASYTLGRQYGTVADTNRNLLTLRAPSPALRATGDAGGAVGSDITSTFKLNVVYDLPIGEGHRVGGDSNGFVSHLLSGWQVGVASIIRSGELIDLGNVRMVGMTKDDLQGMFQLRFDAVGNHVYMLPQEVIDQTINAFNVSATSPTGYAGAPPSGRYFAPANGPDCIELDSAQRYGACASQSLVVTGPMFGQTDLLFSKRTKVTSRTNVQVGVNVLNLFNQPNFIPVGQVGGNTSISAANATNVLSNYEVTQLAGTNTSRLIELFMRFNW